MSTDSGILDISGGCTHPKSIYLKSEDSGRPLQIIVGCGHRYDKLCPECAEKWRRRNRRRFRQVLANCNPKDLRMLTLTLKKDFKDQPMTGQIKELWNYRKELFRYLRDLGYKIKAWVACVELPNHMHIVMESDYIPQSTIKEKWLDITADSFYVFINQWQNVRDMKRFALFYLTKYLTKLGDIGYEIAMSLKGFHLVGSNMGPRQKDDNEQPEKRERWIRIDQLEFEAIYLDFYSYEVPNPVLKKLCCPLDRWCS